MSDRDQLIRLPVTNSRFGTMNSRRSQSITVVARIRIRATFPSTPPTVTMSPTRIGCSVNRIRPETKLENTSWRPNASPKVRAAASHWIWDHASPRDPRPAEVPTMAIP